MYKPIYENDGKDKAVSTIIATILIVAITVVLAATLYVVISGYDGMIGKSTPQVGVKVSTTSDQTTISITSVGGNVSLTDVKMQFTLGGTDAGSYTTTVLGTSPITGNPARPTGVTVSVSGGGGFVSGLTVITVTFNAGDTFSSLKLVDTSTSGTMVSWPT